MGWRGTLRTVQATLRQVERDSQRRQRLAAKKEQEYQKQLELEAAHEVVAEFEEYLARIVSLHRESVTPVNWSSRADLEPKRPARMTAASDDLKERLRDFRVGAFGRLFGGEDRKRAALQSAIEEADLEETIDYGAALRKFEADLEDWRGKETHWAAIRNREPEALMSAIKALRLWQDLSDLGSSVSIEVGDNGLVEASLHVHGEDVIPKDTFSLLRSGRLSQKRMPASRYFGFFQDYVCGASLRVARDLLASLPIDWVIVNAVDEILDTSTGHLEKKTILSLCAPRSTLEKLRFERLDPSDALVNFVHRMKFKATKGFSAVQPLKASDLPEAMT